jgi:hypothetical protein
LTFSRLHSVIFQEVEHFIFITENPKSNRVNYSYYLIKSIQWADRVYGVKVVLVIKGVLGNKKVGKHNFMGSSEMIGVSPVKPVALCHNTLNVLLP